MIRTNNGAESRVYSHLDRFDSQPWGMHLLFNLVLSTAVDLREIFDVLFWYLLRRLLRVNLHIFKSFTLSRLSIESSIGNERLRQTLAIDQIDVA